MAYSVAQRTRMVLERGALLTGAGLVAGIIGALALTGFMEKMLFDTKPFDPLTIAAVSVSLAAIALLASYLPARRATKVDPLVTLRVE